MPRPWIINNAAEATGEIVIRGPIGDWMIEDGDIAAQLAALADAREITVRINSLGGQVGHAISIFNQLREHPARIVVRIEAMAASSASIVAMAGDEIIMPANTLMMIHNPWTYAEGDAETMRAAADSLEKFTGLLIETYVARTGKAAEEVQALLDATTWMTAREAVAMGFADRVEEIGRASAQAYAAALDIPADVLARLDAETTPEPEPAPEPASEPDPAPQTADARALARHILTICNQAKFPELAEVIMANDAIQTTEQADAALVQAQEIRTVCLMAHLPEAAAGYIQAGLSVEAVRARLFDRLVSQDPSINNAPPLETAPAQAQGPDAKTIYRNRKKKGD